MKILVIDDHAIVRDGVRRLFGADLSIEVLEAASARDGLTLFKMNEPELVMLDLNLPGLGGLELIGRLRAERPGAKILVFSMHADAIFAARALDAGAAGYITKNASPSEIIHAVKQTTSGGRYIEHEIAQQLALLNASAGVPHRFGQLSRRELEIMRLLGEGRSLLQIADAVGVSYKTIANTCSQIKAKLGAPRTADLIRLAVEDRIRATNVRPPALDGSGANVSLGA